MAIILKIKIHKFKSAKMAFGANFNCTNIDLWHYTNVLTIVIRRH